MSAEWSAALRSGLRVSRVIRASLMRASDASCSGVGSAALVQVLRESTLLRTSLVSAPAALSSEEGSTS